MSRHTLTYLFLAFSLIGFLDASYLTIKHYRGETPPCSLVAGCEAVTTSQYSLLWNVPVALVGAIYYLTILFLSIYYLDSRKSAILNLAATLTVVGFVASLYFIILQWLVIKAWCLYCLASAATSTSLFALGLITIFHPPANWWNQFKSHWR